MYSSSEAKRLAEPFFSKKLEMSVCREKG